MKAGLIIALFLLSGCASITPIMATVGAGASMTGAYYQVKGQENITILSKECLFLDNFLPLKLADEEKAALTRPTKEKLAGLNLSYNANCLVQ